MSILHTLTEIIKTEFRICYINFKIKTKKEIIL